MLVKSESEYKLKSAPEYTISSVTFAPNSNQILLTSSWDKSVRLHDVMANTLKHKYSHNAPVLDCCFTDTVHYSYSGGLDNTLKRFDYNKTSETIVGNHSNAIKCVEYCADVNGILTGSWDNYLKLWDPRSHICAGNYNQGEKIFTMSVCGEKIIVGTARRRVLIWDIRNMAYALQKRESNLKYQTRSIRCFPNREGFALSSIEGRVAVEYLDTNPVIQKKKYAFKCHRTKENGLERVYPVNAISFHPTYNTFATGGSDGYVNIWDRINRKRLCQFHQYHTSITSLSFSDNGCILAIACSYVLQGDNPVTPLPEDAVYIRTVTDQETKPKHTSS